MSIQPYTVEAFWDVEASVWVATSETILGLVTEADTIEDLTQKLRKGFPGK
jgi:predicted RNase H-like HicB family nuclease